MRVAVLLVTLVGIEISCSKEKEMQRNLDNPLLQAASVGYLFCIFFAENFFLMKD